MLKFTNDHSIKLNRKTVINVVLIRIGIKCDLFADIKKKKTSYQLNPLVTITIRL